MLLLLMMVAGEHTSGFCWGCMENKQLSAALPCLERLAFDPAVLPWLQSELGALLPCGCLPAHCRTTRTACGS